MKGGQHHAGLHLVSKYEFYKEKEDIVCENPKLSLSKIKEKKEENKKQQPFLNNCNTEMIIVPSHLLNCVPSGKGFKKALKYYQEHKALDKPIIVTKTPSGYKLVLGYARYYVAKMYGEKTVPIIVDSPLAQEWYDLCQVDTIVINEKKLKGIVVGYTVDTIFIKLKNNKTIECGIEYCLINKLWKKIK